MCLNDPYFYCPNSIYKAYKRAYKVVQTAFNVSENLKKSMWYTYKTFNAKLSIGVDVVVGVAVAYADDRIILSFGHIELASSPCTPKDVVIGKLMVGHSNGVLCLGGVQRFLVE